MKTSNKRKTRLILSYSTRLRVPDFIEEGTEQIPHIYLNLQDLDSVMQKIKHIEDFKIPYDLLSTKFIERASRGDNSEVSLLIHAYSFILNKGDLFLIDDTFLNESLGTYLMTEASRKMPTWCLATGTAIPAIGPTFLSGVLYKYRVEDILKLVSFEESRKIEGSII